MRPKERTPAIDRETIPVIDAWRNLCCPNIMDDSSSRKQCLPFSIGGWLLTHLILMGVDRLGTPAADDDVRLDAG